MRIFLSHKTRRDKERAERIKSVLEGLEKGKIDVFVSSADIAAAERWPRRIRQELRRADLLLLLYTDPNLDWAWCMYEAGMYARIDSDPEDDDPVTFLYHVRGVPPTQLQANQGIRANEEEVEKFLRDLVKKVTGRPKLTDARRKRVDAATAAIVGEFPDADSYQVSYMASIEITGWKSGKGIPRRARVTTTGSTASVLGKAGSDDMTWEELTERYRGPGRARDGWLKELDAAFEEAVHRRPCAIPRETFESNDHTLILRPALHSIDRIGGRPVRAEIVFVAELAPADVGGPAFAMVRALERNNSEILEPFLHFSTGTPILTDEATTDKILQRVELIQNDIGRGRVFAKDRLAMYGDAADDVGALVKTWNTNCGKLKRSCGAKRPDYARIAGLLAEMRQANNALAQLASEKYATLVASRPDF